MGEREALEADVFDELALIGLAVAGTIGWWGYIGIVPLLTGTFRVCPAYLPFGINTCATDKK